MNNEKYNINISIDERSIQLCIDGKFYRITNSSNSKDEFQMVGMQIMDMVDSLDDILQFREVPVIKLDDIMNRKVNAFAQLLANSVLPKQNEAQIDRFVKTNVGQQIFKSVTMKQDDIRNKEVQRTLSVCRNEYIERTSNKNKIIDYTDDKVLEEAIQKMYKEKIEAVEEKPVIIKEANKEMKKAIKETKKVIETIKKEKPKETIAQTIQKDQEWTFDQQYLIDSYIKHFGKNKVPRSQYLQEGFTSRFAKLFGGYTNFVNAVLA